MYKNSINYLDDMTILFVDDEDGVRSSYEALLNIWSNKAYSASNGEEGLEAFKKFKPDIVITDIKMPVMNGLMMARYIKDINPEIPIIITTAHEEPELLLDAIELHVDGYIIKPIAKKELKKRLERVAKAILFERQKNKENDILKNIIDTSLEAVLVYKGTTCINVNSAAVEMFGFNNKDEIIGKDNLKQIGKALKCVQSKDMECNFEKPYETLLFNKDNEAVSALVRCKNIIISKEKLKIIDAIDLTHIKKLEAQAKKKEEIMLSQSRHAAMGEMISMIAHQWRQPISVIAMGANNILADIALDMLEKESLKSGANNIILQTKELSKTIDDFRNFFRPAKEAEDVLVEDILSEVFAIVEKSLENNNIEVFKEFKNEKKISTYSRELMQVFINILKNAKEVLVENIKEDRKIFISIKESKNKVVIKICDNAGGIKVDILNKIFDPYFTTKNEINGTGLGLYISKTIIEKHLNGTLNAYNKDDGACFEISLPYILNES